MKRSATTEPFTTQVRGIAVREVILAIVVGSIAAGIVISFMHTASDRGKRLHAHGIGTQLVVAAHAYYAEYAEFPAFPSVAEASGKKVDLWVGDPVIGAQMHNNTLMDVLRAIPRGSNADHRLNTRRVGYFDGKEARIQNGVPMDGILAGGNGKPAPPAGLAGCIFDPWGREYGIVMDYSGDDRIDMTGIYRDLEGGRTPRKKVGVFSTGQDRELGNEGDRFYGEGNQVSDDSISWQ